MATGAIDRRCGGWILIDARKGVQTQTRRSFVHRFRLLGIQHVVVAINKWHLVDADQQQFEAIAEDYRTFANKPNIPDGPNACR